MYRVTPWRRVLAHTSTRLRGWPRLVLAAGCVALAASSGLSARSNADPRATVPVVVASHALAAGTVLRAADVRTARWSPPDAPAAALHDVDAALGAVAAAPLTAGEAITPARLRGIGLTVGLRPGTMAVTVVLDNPANAAIIHAGDIVDLLLVTEVDRAATTVPAARLLADRIRVLAALPPTDRPGEDRATLVVAADRATAARLAAVSGRAVVATLRAPP